MRSSRIIAAAVAVAIAVVVSGFAVAAAQPSGPVVKIGSSKLGRILVDGRGKTLYLWAHDKGRQSTCNGDCAEYWPPLIAKAAPQATGGAMARLLGTSRRADGRMQVTYNGHPLYYFVKDRKAGQTSGEGLTGFGGRWDPVSAAGSQVRRGSTTVANAYAAQPVQARILTPEPGALAGVGGTFSVDVALQAQNAQGNRLLSGFTSRFNDPNAPTFHPGPNAAAPGLVVMLSTTPRIAGTPLQGPKTNLAGVFQINDVARISGLKRTFNSWIVTVPGFFGKAKQATLTAYAVKGTAPALVTGTEQQISNVVREQFTIAG